MSELHARGEPCPVVDLLVNHFGEQYGGYLLWNYTCFPFSDVEALKHAEKLVNADKEGRLGEYMATCPNEATP